jgi:hypothetical protein
MRCGTIVSFCATTLTGMIASTTLAANQMKIPFFMLFSFEQESWV